MKFHHLIRWLDTIKTQNKWGQAYQNISYSFDVVGNVLGYENDCLGNASGNYRTKQTYSYDNLYQLIKADGETTYNPYQSSVPEFVSTYSQSFSFDADGLGNMASKVSTETVTPQKSIGDNLNYSFAYNYDKNYAHRLINAGGRYYKYDANGNIVCEQDGSFESNGEEVSYHKITQVSENVYSTDYGWGLFKEDDKGRSGKAGSNKYKRVYKWNERNQLVSSVDDNYSTAYIYGQDGQRANKYTQSSETLYFSKMWTLHTDSGNNIYGGQTAKNIYLGDTRIVTKLNSGTNPTYQEEYYKQYYYHSDHLGSATLISDYKGDEYQRIEYTPYGETWVEKTSNTGLEYLPYKFTGKEIDEETGLYYYGARYLDPRYSRWLSTDPALGEYVPSAGKATASDTGSLPGMGGIFNTVNFHLYHYAGNNPVKYIDPDGRIVRSANLSIMMTDSSDNLGNSNEKICNVGCVLTAYTRIVAAILGSNISIDDANKYAKDNNLFSDGNLLTIEAGESLINGLLEDNGVTDTKVKFAGSFTSKNQDDLISAISRTENLKDEYFVNGRIETTNQDGTQKYGHHVNINHGAVFADTDNGCMNLSINDTNGVRKKLYHDSRSNTLQRFDLFKIIKTQSGDN